MQHQRDHGFVQAELGLKVDEKKVNNFGTDCKTQGTNPYTL